MSGGIGGGGRCRVVVAGWVVVVAVEVVGGFHHAVGELLRKFSGWNEATLISGTCRFSLLHGKDEAWSGFS